MVCAICLILYFLRITKWFVMSLLMIKVIKSSSLTHIIKTNDLNFFGGEGHTSNIELVGDTV